MLLTPREAAHRLGVSYPTLKQWIYKGDRADPADGRRPPPHPGLGDRAPPRLGRAARCPRPAPRHDGAIVALSGRNQLRGIVDEVRTEGLLAQVRLRIGDQTLTAIITKDAVDELKLRRGDEALAVVKSTEVMIARQVSRIRRSRTNDHACTARRRRRLNSRPSRSSDISSALSNVSST